MMLSTSYKSEYCTKTQTQSCSIPPRECPSHHWEIIWETWRTNCRQTTISWNLPPEVQKTTGTRPTKVKRTVKSEASHSIVWGREKQRAGRLDFPTGVWRSTHHRRAHTIQNREEHPRIPIVHHGPTKKIQVGLQQARGESSHLLNLPVWVWAVDGRGRTRDWTAHFSLSLILTVT